MNDVSDELTKALLLEEVASRDAVAGALFASLAGDIPLLQALVDTRALSAAMLARYLSRGDAPQLRQVVPLVEVVEKLPAGLCARLLALPVRRDAITGTVDVVVADASDPHPAREIAFHIGAPVRLVRASVGAIEDALQRLRTHSLPAPPARVSGTAAADEIQTTHLPSSSSLGPPGAVNGLPDPSAGRRTSGAAGRTSRAPSQDAFTAAAIATDDDRLYDSRPRGSTGPSARNFRGNTLPPADPALRVPGSRVMLDALSAEALRPSRVPSSQRQAYVLPGLAQGSPRPSVTPPWGTEVSASQPVPEPVNAPKSEPPRSGLGSEIPIPLTRRTFTAVSGGTQRPPPFVDPRDPLGEGYAVDVANFRQIVEVNERSRIVDGTAHSPPAIVDARGVNGGGNPSTTSPRGGTGFAQFDSTDGLSKGAANAIANTRPSNPPPPRASMNPGASAVGLAIGAASFIPGPPPLPGVGPFNAFAAQVALSDVGGILAALRAAGSRDEILELVLTGARMVAHRVGIFVVKRGGYLGWACTPELGDRTALQAILVPLESPSIFDEAVRDGVYLGPLRHDETHAALLHVMRGAARDVAAVPIRVSGRAAVVILADELGDTMLATRRLEELARAAGDAFARIVRMRR